jgi:hypothetical protein
LYLSGFGPPRNKVTLGESGVAKPLRDGVRGSGRIADGVGRVDLDELFIDVVSELLSRRQRL